MLFLVYSISRSPARWHAALAMLFAVLLATELFGLHTLDTTEYRLGDIFMLRRARASKCSTG